jgi:glycosyltransferase involved in cell wall biosynthesis
VSARASVRRRVLLVAYFYPPLNSIGVRRPYALAKWLRRRGHEVTVLTSVQSGTAPDDAAQGVVRTRDLLATRLNWRGDSMRTVTGQSDATWDPDPGVWGKIFVPDVHVVSWMPFLAATALWLHRRHRFDAVISTSPLEVAHAAGLSLRRVPWIADFRDGWRYEAPRADWPLALQRRLDDALERLVVKRADVVVTVSQPLSDDLRRRHGIAVETVTNGFDPDDESGVGTLPPGAVDPAKVTFVHTGGLGSERTLRPLLEALARMEPELSGRVEIVLAGQQTVEERGMYAEPAYAPYVRHLGYVERPTALTLQRAADVLVLVTSGARTGEVTGKLFEYLAAGKPILALAGGSAAGTILGEAKAGIVIPTHDTGAAEHALRRILGGELDSLPEGPHSAFGYPAIAERYEGLIERAIAARLT